MQVVGFFAAIGLVILMGLSGYQLVPENATASVSLVSPSVQVSTRADSSPLASQEIVSTPTETTITIRQVQNIEANTASLRAAITVGQESVTNPFFIYGYQESRVEGSIGRSKSYEEVLENLRSGVVVRRVDRQVTRDESYSTRVGDLAFETQYSVRFCGEVVDALRCTSEIAFTTNPTDRDSSDTRIPTIRAYDEELISNDEVALHARINMRDTEDGIVYLIYGESRSQVEAAAELDYGDIDEDGEDLQRKRIATQVRGERDVRIVIDDLREETEQFYIFCVEYDGERDGTVCTRLESFETPDEEFGETPRITTDTPSVTGTTVTLAGDVRMGSLNNGQVFFVYGTDERSIGRIGGETTMDRIRQSGDNLQRVLVDSDLDSNDSYTERVTGLLTDQEYTTRLCVEYENQDQDLRDRQFVACSEMVGFETN